MVTLPSQLRKAAQNLPLLRSQDIQEPFASLHRVLASLPQLTPEFRIKTRVNEKAGISRDKRAPETRWPAGHKYVVLTELFLPCRKDLCISFSVDLISSFPKLSREFQVSFLYYFLEKQNRKYAKIYRGGQNRTIGREMGFLVTFNSSANIFRIHNNHVVWVVIFLFPICIFLLLVNWRQFHLFFLFLFGIFLGLRAFLYTKSP